MLILVLFFFLALGASFVCSISESGFLSLSRADIAGLISKGRRKGKVLEGMKNKVDKPLAAILTLNTVANMVGAAGVGAAANTIWGARGTAVASAMLTVLILVFGEIIPKTLGSRYAVMHLLQNGKWATNNGEISDTALDFSSATIFP